MVTMRLFTMMRSGRIEILALDGQTFLAVSFCHLSEYLFGGLRVFDIPKFGKEMDGVR